MEELKSFFEFGSKFIKNSLLMLLLIYFSLFVVVYVDHPFFNDLEFLTLGVRSNFMKSVIVPVGSFTFPILFAISKYSENERSKLEAEKDEAERQRELDEVSKLALSISMLVKGTPIYRREYTLVVNDYRDIFNQLDDYKPNGAKNYFRLYIDLRRSNAQEIYNQFLVFIHSNNIGKDIEALELKRKDLDSNIYTFILNYLNEGEAGECNGVFNKDNLVSKINELEKVINDIEIEMNEIIRMGSEKLEKAKTVE